MASFMSRKVKQNLIGLGFVSLAVIGVFVFKLGPVVVSLWYSFTDYDVVSQPQFVGLENYKAMVADPLFWKSLVNTVYYAGVSLPLRLILALFFAFLLNQKFRGMAFFRTVFYLPSVTAGVAIALLWTWVFEPTFGVVNNVLRWLGIAGPTWLGSPQWAMPAVIIAGVWQMGQQMLIFLAGLQTVPTQLYEVAELDGASSWQKFRSVTLPLISPIVFFNLVVGWIQAFQVFEKVYIMTGGGPVNATMVIVMYLYKRAFTFLQMGYGSAVAWALFIIIFGLTLLQFRTSRWVYYEN
ncbi:MAG: carbohydrate ABC transporter permease [Limnochordia bacterium]|jgi:multiple sugar transport system permease protein